MRVQRLIAAAVFIAAAAAGAAAAQADRAVVVEEAPVYLLPNAARTPLRVLAVNTQLKVLAEEGEWIRVEFPDEQFGPRIGYIQTKKVRIFRDQVQPKPTTPSTEPTQKAPPPPTKRPTTRSSRLGARAYGTYGGTRFTASDTLQATGSDSTLVHFGGGGTITGLWRGLFVDVGFSHAETDGQRVFVDEGTVYPLGVALKLTVQSLDLVGGWRWRLTTGRLSPYIGGGVTLTSYKETSAFSEPEDDLRERKPGPMMLAGLDVTLVNWVHVGGELRYRAVSGILGENGVSEAFGEDDAGGLALAVRVSFGR